LNHSEVVGSFDAANCWVAPRVRLASTIPQAAEERSEGGRLLNGFISHGIAFLCWIDFADRQVKVLGLTRAD